MDHDEGGPLRIGVFSTLSRISVRMLRHYQEHGLLEPAEVDPFTGRRYYRARQLVDAHLIVQLRDAGFPVEAIRGLLDGIDDPARVDAAIAAQRERLRSARDEVHARLAALDRVGSTLKERPEMTDVRTMTIPEMTVASLRKTLPGYADEGLLWNEIMPLLERSGATLPAGGICGATFHDTEYRDTDVDVEAWVQVAAPFDPVAPLVCRVQPSQDIVTATLTGDYSQMPGVTAAIGAYIAEHDLATGPMFDIYRVGPAQNPDPSSWVTEVCFPVVG
ncbi:MerR family transcriptional regulator [Brooklawnia cerclae]|uniref:DNA-binding transcriptional MerR regulator n=1 Tax=Brooklawnia cerclae TaxID=349934 RepID=A0ABX0SLP0_9ACTN|nr:MerR family transcriptional regulator [Brooklawnia cerclae]NIH58238.1 DNA-binding transcriptional MerR regulator [Brooklawnia cerclae]